MSIMGQFKYVTIQVHDLDRKEMRFIHDVHVENRIKYIKYKTEYKDATHTF